MWRYREMIRTKQVANIQHQGATLDNETERVRSLEAGIEL